MAGDRRLGKGLGGRRSQRDQQPGGRLALCDHPRSRQIAAQPARRSGRACEGVMTVTATDAHPASPCLGICLMDPATRICRGCLLTIDEIRAWYEVSPAEKRAILARLDARLRAVVQLG